MSASYVKRPVVKETVAYYVYWFSGEERECIGSADTREDAWAIARKWIGETFPKLNLHSYHLLDAFASAAEGVRTTWTET